MSEIRRQAYGAFLFLLSVGASAQPVDGMKLAPGTRVVPEISAVFLSDSNFYNSRTDEESVTGSIVSPAVRLESNSRRSQFAAGASAQAGFFDNGDQDDYVDSHLYGRYHYQGGVRHRFSVGLARHNEHDAFGRRRTEGTALRDQDLDEYRENVANVGYKFGATNALINARIDFNYLDREYTTNRDQGTKFLDYDAFEQKASLFYNVSPKTAVVFKFSNRDIEYPETRAGFPNRAATERRASVGFEWLATGKTTGRFFIGGMERDPDSNEFDTFSGLDWGLSMDWSPRPTTTISLATSRETDESFLVNSSFIDKKSAAAGWLQQWSRIFSTTFKMTRTERDFEDVGRTDDTIAAELTGTLQVAKNIQVFTTASYIDRESNFQARIFDKSTFLVGFKYQR